MQINAKGVATFQTTIDNSAAAADRLGRWAPVITSMSVQFLSNGGSALQPTLVLKGYNFLFPSAVNGNPLGTLSTDLTVNFDGVGGSSFL